MFKIFNINICYNRINYCKSLKILFKIDLKILTFLILSAVRYYLRIVYRSCNMVCYAPSFYSFKELYSTFELFDLLLLSWNFLSKTRSIAYSLMKFYKTQKQNTDKTFDNTCTLNKVNGDLRSSKRAGERTRNLTTQNSYYDLE